MRQFFCFILGILFLSCGCIPARVAMAVLDTETWNIRRYNSAPSGCPYREVFLATGEYNTLYGALREDSEHKGKITRYDLSTGTVLEEYLLSGLDFQVAHDEFTLFFPEAAALINYHVPYQENKQIGPPQIVKVDIKTLQRDIVYTMDAESSGTIARVDDHRILITEDFDCKSKKSSELILLDIKNKEFRKCLLSNNVYNIQSVSPNGHYALLSTLHKLLLFDIREMKVIKSLSEHNDVFSFSGSFSPQSSKIIYSVLDHAVDKQKIFIFDTATEKTTELDSKVFKSGDIYSPRFLNDTSIVFNKREKHNCKIIFYNLQTRTVEKEIFQNSVMSSLFITGKYVIFME